MIFVDWVIVPLGVWVAGLWFAVILMLRAILRLRQMKKQNRDAVALARFKESRRPRTVA